MERKLIKVYCDESRQTAARYMLLGGIWIPSWHEEEANNKCCAFRNDNGMWGHMKWTKVKKQKIQEYKDFINIFFEQMNARRAAFRCMVIDTNQLDIKKYSKGDEELQFYKLYYLYLLNKLDKCYRNLVFLDPRQDKKKTRLSTLKIVLNRGAKKKFNIDYNLVSNVEPKPSAESNFIQMADILMGAVGFHWNVLHLKESASEAKIEMANHIAGMLNKRDLHFESPKNGDRFFNIWFCKFPQKAKRPNS